MQPVDSVAPPGKGATPDPYDVALPGRNSCRGDQSKGTRPLQQLGYNLGVSDQREQGDS